MPIQHLRSQTYDSASNISGTFCDCLAKIKMDQLVALYMHYSAHIVQLFVCKGIQKNAFLRNSLDHLGESTVTFDCGLTNF